MNGILRGVLIAGVSTSLLWALPATAQRRGDREVRNPPTSNQIVDQADARIAALKADLHLTSDEDKNWGGFQSTLHDIAVQRADRWSNIQERRTAAGGEMRDTPAQADANTNSAPANEPANTDTAQNPPAAIEALRNVADSLSRRADELKKIADAAQPLYASLDDQQRRQLMSFIQRNEMDVQAVGGREYRGRR